MGINVQYLPYLRGKRFFTRNVLFFYLKRSIPLWISKWCSFRTFLYKTQIWLYSRWANDTCIFSQTYIPIFPSHILKLNELAVSYVVVYIVHKKLASVHCMYMCASTHELWNDDEHKHSRREKNTTKINKE